MTPRMQSFIQRWQDPNRPKVLPRDVPLGHNLLPLEPEAPKTPPRKS